MVLEGVVVVVVVVAALPDDVADGVVGVVVVVVVLLCANIALLVPSRDTKSARGSFFILSPVTRVSGFPWQRCKGYGIRPFPPSGFALFWCALPPRTGHSETAIERAPMHQGFLKLFLFSFSRNVVALHVRQYAHPRGWRFVATSYAV
ncbi:MAG TPA: hypothetical protein VGE12_16465 [Noviherbaspirillum sp.]